LASDRAAGRPLTDSDRLILEDIAQQLGIALYVSRLTADLQASRESLVISQEEERRRIRNDLHDGLAPSLSSFQLQLSAIRTFLQRNPSEAEKLIEELTEDMRQATREIRSLVYGLRPPMLDDLGLVAAIEHIKLPASALLLVVNAPRPLPPLSAATEVAVYRITNEAIHKVVKHADATCCAVAIEVDAGTLLLIVSDDGKNPAVSPTSGIGIQSMKERATELGGTFSIYAREDKGTQIEVRLPLETR
jgi:signal transduction histidine kinase